MKIGRRRLLIGASAITGLGAAAMLVAGTTFGFFSATTNSNGAQSFTAGTVVVGNPVSSSCTIGPLVPLDSSAGWAGNPITGQDDSNPLACTFSVDYSGSVPADIGLYVSTSGSGLYDGSANGLQLQITDNNDAAYTTSGVLNGTTAGGTAADPLFVATDSGQSSGSHVTHTFTVNWFLPNSTSANNYQGLATTLTLTVEAVQSGNNAGTCTAGSQCSTNPSWS